MPVPSPEEKGGGGGVKPRKKTRVQLARLVAPCEGPLLRVTSENRTTALLGGRESLTPFQRPGRRMIQNLLPYRQGGEPNGYGRKPRKKIECVLHFEWAAPMRTSSGRANNPIRMKQIYSQTKKRKKGYTGYSKTTGTENGHDFWNVEYKNIK